MSKVLAIVLVIALLAGAVYGVQKYYQSPETVPQEQVSTSTPTMNGKINIVEVCQSSLMYTTFTDGAAADAYIEACIRGEHPEVIERWKQDNGYGNGEAI